MDPLFVALSLYRRQHYEKCIDACTSILVEKPYDEAAWTLKMKALTQQIYVDDLETEEEGIADLMMDENSIAQIARPGTSLKNPNTAKGTSQAFRPVTQSGRPLSGIVRPGTQSARPGTMEQAIRTRTTLTARPITSSSGRFVRMGTASMMSQQDGPFINFARLNIAKYASLPHIAKHLFEYAFYHENDTRQALDIASQATQACKFEDWWWKFQLGKCYYRFGMLRDAEKQFKSSIKQQDMIDTYVWMGKVYIALDQPLAALEVYKQALVKFPEETSLMIHAARIYEELNDTDLAVKYYRDVLSYEAIDVEAIACIAANHFYNDQPEVALRYYRRLLQMGVCNSELYNNLGLCCFYSQQHDMAVMCFERGLALATDDTLADVWYNIAHLALGIGDKNLATQCLRLALVANNDHAESYNNLGVLEGIKGNLDQAKSFFVAASNLGQHLFEPHYNQALLAEKVGDFQTSFIMTHKSLNAYPDHADSKDLFQKIKNMFTLI